ncbi:MAG: tetratricopeptide repeat protein [Longimicrobiales bacterium]
MEQRHRDLIERARRSFDRRDYPAALADFRSVLEEHPKYADLRHLCGVCLSFLGQPEAAIEEFDRALAVNDQYVEAHLNRALTLNELGRFEEAASAFERAGYYEYAVAGRFPAAIMARLAQAHASVGDLYREAGAPLEAAAQYRRALELRPRFHDIRNKLAQSLLHVGDTTGAAEQLRTALSGNPRYIPARLNLGLALHRLGDRAGARREWEECRTQEPDNPQVSAYLALLDQGEA